LHDVVLIAALKVTATAVVKITSTRTVNGQAVTIRAAHGAVMVDNAKVVKTDIETSNGVIHVLDTVVLPQGSAASLPAAEA